MQTETRKESQNIFNNYSIFEKLNTTNQYTNYPTSQSKETTQIQPKKNHSQNKQPYQSMLHTYITKTTKHQSKQYKNEQIMFLYNMHNHTRVTLTVYRTLQYTYYCGPKKLFIHQHL